MALISSTVGPYRRHDLAGRCPVCGEKSAACGGPSNHIPIEIPTEVRQEAGVSGPLLDYRVKVAGREVLLQLNLADAQRMGGVPVTEPETNTSPDRQPASEKAQQPPNKARTPPNKGQPTS